MESEAKVSDEQRPPFLWGVGAVIGIGIFAALYFSGALGKFSPGPGTEKQETPSPPTAPTARNAFDIAFLEAQKWQPDARLAFLNSGPVQDGGRSSAWKLAFGSEKALGKIFIVEVADFKVISTNEMSYKSTGADFPVDIISADEAIKKVRAIRGYENETILGVEAVYDVKGKVWYWGVRTPKGVVSVEAKKK